MWRLSTMTNKNEKEKNHILEKEELLRVTGTTVERVAHLIQFLHLRPGKSKCFVPRIFVYKKQQ